MSTRNKRHKRGTDWSKITDAKLSEILSHPHTQGSDGVDYEPYREELLSEQYRRYEARSIEALRQFNLDQKAQLKQTTQRKLKQPTTKEEK